MSPIARVHLEDIKTRAEHALDAIPSMPAQRPTPGSSCAAAPRLTPSPGSGLLTSVVSRDVGDVIA